MDPSLSCKTVLVPTTTSHKERAEPTRILASRTRPRVLQLQLKISGPLFRGSWGHFLSIREKPSTSQQVRNTMCSSIFSFLIADNQICRELWWTLVSFFGAHISSFDPNIGPCDMAWKCLLCGQIPKLAYIPQTSNINSEISSGPVFNEYIESQNAKAIPGARNISLETVLIGNGWYNPLIQVSSLKIHSQGRRSDSLCLVPSIL